MKKSKRFSRVLSLLLTVLTLFSVVAIGVPTAFSAEKEITEVAAESETKTYYFSPNGYWSNLFAVYAWSEDTGAAEWKQLTKIDSEGNLWSVELSAEYTNAIFCSRTIPAFAWTAVDYQTDELTLQDGYNYLTLAGETTAMWGYYSDGDDSLTTETKKVYFTPNADWTDIQSIMYHDFVVHAYSADDTDGVWADFELVEGEFGVYPNVWEAEIPADYDSVVFCRVENSTVENSWFVWEQTDEQTIPADSNRFFQDIESSTGTWSYYEAPETEPSEEESSESDSTDPGSSDPVVPGNTKPVYFTANENWLSMISQGIGSVYVYTWTTDADNGTWTGADALENTNVYKVDVPEDDINIRFGLSYGTSPEAVWSVTDDQKIPDDQNHFTQDEAGNSGTWSYYAESGTPAGRYYSVVFLNADNTFLKVQVVAEGGSATAPNNPEMAADEQYTYTFAGWDKSFTNVKADLIVTATYMTDIKEYIVTFVDSNDAVISAQPVAYGSAAEAPQAPTVEGYEFSGWDTEFDYITKDITVKATYKKISTPVAPATTGGLKVEVSGGTGFTISVNGGTARPQGATYMNTKMPIGATVTVAAQATDGAEFIGWISPDNGKILSKDLTYTFTSTGNDFVKATFATKVEGVQLVKFVNDKAQQILDIQYYTSTETIEFPAAPFQVGFDFTGWDMTEAEIKNAIAAGQDVTVTAQWTKQLVYVNVTVIGGTGGGQVLANNACTVTANSPEAGMKFAYWVDGNGNIKSYQTSYKIFPASDITLEAVFVGEDAVVEQKVIISLDTIDTTSASTVNTFYYSWSLPEGYTVVQGGLIAVNKANYNEATFYANSTDSNVYTRPKTSKKDLVYAGSWNKTNVAAGETWIAQAFIIYKDVNGITYTVYSQMVEATKD